MGGKRRTHRSAIDLRASRLATTTEAWTTEVGGVRDDRAINTDDSRAISEAVKGVDDVETSNDGGVSRGAQRSIGARGKLKSERVTVATTTTAAADGTSDDRRSVGGSKKPTGSRCDCCRQLVPPGGATTIVLIAPRLAPHYRPPHAQNRRYSDRISTKHVKRWTCDRPRVRRPGH